MNSLGQYVQRQMDGRGWSATDLMQHAGLSRAELDVILGLELDAMPSAETLLRLADAVGEPYRGVVLRAAQACGLSVGNCDSDRSPTLREASDDELLRELRRRVLRGAIRAETRDSQRGRRRGLRSVSQ